MTFLAAHHPYVHQLLHLGRRYAQMMEMHGPLDPLRERFLYAESRALFARDNGGRLIGAPRFQFDDLGRVRPIITESIRWTLEKSLNPLAVWAGVEWWELTGDHARRPLDYLLAWWVLPCPWLVDGARPCEVLLEREREVIRALTIPSYIRERGVR